MESKTADVISARLLFIHTMLKNKTAVFSFFVQRVLLSVIIAQQTNSFPFPRYFYQKEK